MVVCQGPGSPGKKENDNDEQGRYVTSSGSAMLAGHYRVS
jgi:hypothetical protein